MLSGLSLITDIETRKAKYAEDGFHLSLRNEDIQVIPI